MSDYLDHLVEKSTESAPTVRPRLASRFEPQARGAPALGSFLGAGEEEEWLLEPEDETTSTPRLPGPAAPAPFGETRPPPHPNALPPLLAEPGRDAAPARGAGRPAPARGAQPGPPPENGLRNPAPAPRTQAAQPAAAQRSAVSAAQQAPSPAPVHAEPERAPVFRPVLRRRHPAAAGPTRPSTVETPSTDPAQPQAHADRGPPNVVLEPAIAAPVEPAPTTAPAPAPTIQVTIGRIELRSSSPPASARLRRAPGRRGPARSLDAYLKQRNGG